MDESYPRNATVHELFEDQARRTPEAVALVLPAPDFGPMIPTTYRELDQRASDLAAGLRDMGVRPGERIALLMERSPEMVVALLGILKAGCAYVPLDPSYPQERLDFMLADTRAPVLLTQPHLVARAPTSGARTLVLGGEDGGAAKRPSPFVSDPQASDTAAYVIYTSGSTGRPKGVVVPHRAIVRLVIGTTFARLDSTRVVLHLAPISFDAATFEIWGALLHGGRCVLYPDVHAPDLARLRRVIAESGVTTLWLTASLFNLIIDQAPETLETVEEVLTGGEALSVAHVRRALELLPRVQLINGYGPTESTTFACCYRIPRTVPADARSIPIGPPIANTSVFLLDADLRPVAPGDPGDLYIGGDGLAIEYLNSPELTAERFLESPFAGNGERLYRTGDRARMLPDGALEFLGRLDDQIKIRGYRVELGEVEAALRAQPEVGDAVVSLREDTPGEKRLVAYFTLRSGSVELPAGELRTRLEVRLPEQMIPSHFVILEEIPRIPNGKADRRALPAPGRRRPSLERPLIMPRTPVESWVASHWKDLLDLDEVGVHDRFFELGGSSVMALRLLGRLSKDTGSDLPTLILFRAPTVAEMSSILEQEHRAVLPAQVTQGLASAPTAPGDVVAERDAQRRDDLRERRQRRRFAR